MVEYVRCIHKLEGFILGDVYRVYRRLSNRWIEVENEDGKRETVDTFYFE